MLKFDFKDQVVVVTGGASGIGECIAKEFASSGANVVIVDLNEEKINKVVEQIGSQAIPYKMDVTKYDKFVKLYNYLLNRFGKIDIVVNSAGICKMGMIDAMDIETVDAVIDIDLKGTIYSCKAIAPIFKKQKSGKIINMSSIAGRLCDSGSNVYATAKAGIMALTTAIGRELAPYNVNVNSILPGIVRTSMWEGILDDFTKDNNADREEVFKKYTSVIPMKRPQETIDIANMTLFLCSEECKNVTAQNIAVDGGHTLSI